jgi:cell division transport system permease protein
MKETKKLKIEDKGGNIFISFFRGIKLGLNNFWRNKFLSIATIIVMAIIIFIFNVILAIQFIGNQALQSLSERVDIVIYLQDEIEYYDATQLTEALKNIDGVKDVKYTSKEEALEIVGKTHPKTAEFLKKFNLKNPLPPSISITTRSAENHAAIQQFLSQDKYKNMMENYVTEGASGESVILSTVAKNLENIHQFVKQIIFWVVFVFILGGTLIIVNAIQLTIYNRRKEIHIMRLVGATPGFIRLPFVFEGILYAVLAVAISFIILLAISNSIQVESINLLSYYSDFNIYRVFITELTITVTLAIISSFSAAEQYIKGNLTMN